MKYDFWYSQIFVVLLCVFTTFSTKLLALHSTPLMSLCRSFELATSLRLARFLEGADALIWLSPILYSEKFEWDPDVGKKKLNWHFTFLHFDTLTL